MWSRNVTSAVSPLDASKQPEDQPLWRHRHRTGRSQTTRESSGPLRCRSGLRSSASIDSSSRYPSDAHLAFQDVKDRGPSAYIGRFPQGPQILHHCPQSVLVLRFVRSTTHLGTSNSMCEISRLSSSGALRIVAPSGMASSITVELRRIGSTQTSL